MKTIKLHCRRILIEALNLLLNHDSLFLIIGIINRHLRVIETVFLMYPANRKYGLAYAYPARLAKNQWNPWLAGLFFQNGRIGIMLVVSATNEDYRDPANIDQLRFLAGRMEEIRHLFHAEQKTFAGILTGIMNQLRVINENREIDVTVRVIRLAVEKVMAAKGFDPSTPVIILGHQGFIGRRVFADLIASGRAVWGIDVKNGGGRQDWPVCLSGLPAVVVNIADSGVLEQYLDLMWSEVVVINEVYPEPPQAIIDQCLALGLECWHIAGVEAWSLPKFPRAYAGSVPCCAAWPSKDLGVKLRRLS